MTRLAVLAWVLVFGAACSTEPAPSIFAVRSEAVEHGIRLEIESPRAIVRTEEAIEVIASVVNERDDPITLWSSSVGGPVAFGVLRVEDGLAVEPDWTDDGVAYELPSGEPVHYPFQKGIVALGGPNAAFLRAYAADPALHLPRGRWRIDAILHGVLEAPGDPPIMLVATIEVVVTD